MIVKIQKPMNMLPDGEEPMLLAYDHRRIYEEFLDFTPQLKKMMKAKVKIYVEAELDDDNVLQIYREREEQPW